MNQQEIKGDKMDELMKWLRVVLKYTKFSRLLPVLLDCLTMEQIDMIISAKASRLLKSQVNMKNEEEEKDKFATKEKIQVLKIISPSGDSENEGTNLIDDTNDQCNDSDMKLEREEATSNDEVSNDAINEQTNEPPYKEKPPLSIVKPKEPVRCPKTRRLLDCIDCDMVFDTSAKRAYHMDSVHYNRTYQCPLCNQHFSTSTSLKRHQLVHQSIGEFTCKICNKSVKRKTALAEHMRTHTREKPFSCPDCPYRGSSSSLLAHHKRKKHKGGIKMLL